MSAKKKSSIMIVDDEPDITMVLGEFLSREGFRTLVAHTGEQALEKFKKEKIGLVLLDLAIPGMDGIEILKKLKELDKDTNVIMITAYRDAEKVVQAFRLGAYDCIFKPFDFKYLRESITARLLE